MPDVIWEKMPKADRDAYEREQGTKPPGYRGTGQVEWFPKWHAAEAPCCKCGVPTDRWVIGTCFMGDVSWGLPHVDQPMVQTKKRALCAENVYAFCWSCERRAMIAVLQKRQLNMVITSALREREAVSLAELEAEQMAEAA